MDLEIKIKGEPAWLEGIGSASFENIEHVSEMITLKKEVSSELAEPGPIQQNSFEHSGDFKEEIFIEQHTVDQLLPYIKEETKYVHHKRYTEKEYTVPIHYCVRNQGTSTIKQSALQLVTLTAKATPGDMNMRKDGEADTVTRY
ncbi:uncharacterized protein [Anabrus simplex]|uniref:uncharacterized protein n=1 Tax=Anabrus simplex TaxID=316456 RepID=UPI0035A3BD0E